MNGNFTSVEACVRYHQVEGFVVGVAVCAGCRHEWTAIVEPGAALWLECPKCHLHFIPLSFKVIPIANSQ